MINVGIKNTTPNVGLKSPIVNVRISSFQTGRAGDGVLAIGTPIGLLLALTYAVTGSLPNYSDFRPNVRINNL